MHNATHILPIALLLTACSSPQARPTTEEFDTPLIDPSQPKAPPSLEQIPAQQTNEDCQRPVFAFGAKPAPLPTAITHAHSLATVEVLSAHTPPGKAASRHVLVKTIQHHRGRRFPLAYRKIPARMQIPYPHQVSIDDIRGTRKTTYLAALSPTPPRQLNLHHGNTHYQGPIDAHIDWLLPLSHDENAPDLLHQTARCPDPDQ